MKTHSRTSAILIMCNWIFAFLLFNYYHQFLTLDFDDGALKLNDIYSLISFSNYSM